MSIKANLKNIPLSLIDRNPENPRLFFRQEEMEQLYLSIKSKGLLQPIAVYQDGDRYVILDGERRFRTFQKLNYDTIPALIQEKPSKLDNLLLMFNIHSTREQWDIFTIAMKLERIIELYKLKNGYTPNEKELSQETGLTNGVLRRSKLIIDLPERFKNILLKDLSLSKKDQTFSEDFFIEMETALKTVKKYFPNVIFDVDEIRDILMIKYQDKVIKNITDFRKLTKIATSNKNLKIEIEEIETALNHLFKNNTISIEQIYDELIGSKYTDRNISLTTTNFISKIRNYVIHKEIDDEMRQKLIQLRDELNFLISK